MFSKKAPERPRRNHGKLSQYGLFDMPTSFEDNDDAEAHEDNDSDLEVELAALAGGKPKTTNRRRKPPATDENLDAMIQDSLRDIPSDEDVSGDDDDPELLNELQEITGGSLEAETSPQASPQKTAASVDMSKILTERLQMYETAEKNANEAGETSRARRFNRGIKTLRDLIKQNNAGRALNEDDIPPAVTVNVQKKEEAEPSSEDQPVAEISEETQAKLKLLNERKTAFKVAALQAKKAGDMSTAIEHVKIAKQFEAVIKAIESGQDVDLSQMPAAPVTETVAVEESPPLQEQAEQSIEPPPQQQQLITASSVGEALEQRLAVYKEQENNAKEQGNSSKARRMGRIIKQFEQAIKSHNAGKPVAFDELPTPPGYAPIPGTPSTTSSEAPSSPPTENQPPPVPPRRASGNKQPTTRMEKQLALLKQRQQEFKVAALNAKKRGEMNEAKQYLRSAKGFDPLIAAAEGGLPVDITSLPIAPSAKAHLDAEYELVMAEECTGEDDSVMDVIARLEAQLSKQLKTCLSTRDHFKAIGDIAGMNRFEHLALTVTKDLDVVRIARRTNGAAIPKFHYEKRDYSIVKSFTDLNDNDLEVLIVRGINYNCSNPKDIDTYVKFEFPNPNVSKIERFVDVIQTWDAFQDEVHRDKTATIRDTNNPEYNAKFVLTFQRTARPWLRIFKRHAIKFEIYSKGGFLRSDTLLGNVSVKLQQLETQCEIHDSFDMMEGRKKVGGKLEVRLRIRNPLLSREVEQLSERWLIIDN